MHDSSTPSVLAKLSLSGRVQSISYSSTIASLHQWTHSADAVTDGYTRPPSLCEEDAWARSGHRRDPCRRDTASSGKIPMIDLVRRDSTGIWPPGFQDPRAPGSKVGSIQGRVTALLTHRHFLASQNDGGRWWVVLGQRRLREPPRKPPVVS